MRGGGDACLTVCPICRGIGAAIGRLQICSESGLRVRDYPCAGQLAEMKKHWPRWERPGEGLASAVPSV